VQRRPIWQGISCMSSEKISQQIKKYGKPISGELEKFLNKFFPGHVTIHSKDASKRSPLMLIQKSKNGRLNPLLKSV